MHRWCKFNCFCFASSPHNQMHSYFMPGAFHAAREISCHLGVCLLLCTQTCFVTATPMFGLDSLLHHSNFYPEDVQYHVGLLFELKRSHVGNVQTLLDCSNPCSPMWESFKLLWYDAWAVVHHLTHAQEKLIFWWFCLVSRWKHPDDKRSECPVLGLIAHFGWLAHRMTVHRMQAKG